MKRLATIQFIAAAPMAGALLTGVVCADDTMQPVVIPPSVECWDLASCGGTIDFGSGDIPPIPADFFFPGSPEISGQIPLEIFPFSSCAAIVEHIDPIDLPNLGSSDTIDIEIVDLALTSTSPIVVVGEFEEQIETYFLDVFVDPFSFGGGEATVDRHHTNGGTFDVVFEVDVQIVFTNVNDFFDVIEFNPPASLILTHQRETQWNICGPQGDPSAPPRFYVSAGDMVPLASWGGGLDVCFDQAPLSVPGCVAPDSGDGTIDLPADCTIDHPLGICFTVTEGLPPGTNLIVEYTYDDLNVIDRQPGGDLGGQIVQFDANTNMHVSGTGDLFDYDRNLNVTSSWEMHIGPQPAGEPVQIFPIQIELIQLELVGDPDFDELTLTGGDAIGQPSDGLARLVDIGNGEFAVDSFFDVFYEITIDGAPGSPLDEVDTTQSFNSRMGQGVIPFEPSQYFGLESVPTGFACLGDDVDGNMAVANVGPSGFDGASTELGFVDGFKGRYDFGPAGDLKQDSALFWEMLGNFPKERGEQQSIVDVFIREHNDGEALVDINVGAFRNTASRILVHSSTGGQTIDKQIFENLPHVTRDMSVVLGSVEGQGVEIGAARLDPLTCADPDDPDVICNGLAVDIIAPVETSWTVGEETFIGERLCFVFEEPGEFSSVPPATRVDVFGDALAVFDVERAAVIRFLSEFDFTTPNALLRGADRPGLTGQPFGGVEVRNANDDSGFWGVDTTFDSPGQIVQPPVIKTDVGILVEPDPANNGIMDFAVPAFYANLRGGAAWPGVQIVDIGNDLEVRHLFGEFIAGFDALIELRDEGVVVDSYDGPISGEWATIAGDANWPDGAISFELSDAELRNDEITLRITWIPGSDIDITIEGAVAPVAGDELVITALVPQFKGGRGGADRSIDHRGDQSTLLAMFIGARDITSFTIVDLQVNPEPFVCPGDVNGDFIVNVTDLLAVINNWGTAGPAGDVNGDNIVNVADLLEVINNWGAACL